MEKYNIKIPNVFSEMNKTAKIKNPLFVLKDISKSYFDKDLFFNINLTVNSNDRIAVVGRNGIGKSALLKIIMEIEEKDKGSIIKNKNLKIGYLPQETHWDSLKNTVLSEVNSVNSKQLIDDRRFKVLIEYFLKNFGFSEQSWERQIKTLSGGERTRLAIIKILIFNPNLLVLDEPTNHLDLETIEWLEQFLLNWNKAIVCVSHDRYFLDKICDKTFELTKNGLEKYYCNYSGYLAEKQKKIGIQEKQYKDQQKYLKKQQKFIDRFRYKATIASRVQSRIKSLEKVELKESPEASKSIKINFDIKEKFCSKVLEINNLKVKAKDLFLFEISDSLKANWGDKIGIIGNNGTGKSSLLKTILDKCENNDAGVKIGQGIQIGYYAQAHEELDPEKNILEQVSFSSNENEEKIRNVLGCLLFTQTDVFKKIKRLSGGERARIALAELILQKSNLLLLDEPTNHLDLESKEIISNVLKEFQGTILLVSHDRFVLNSVCNVIWAIKDKKLKEYLGGYDDYRYYNKKN